MFSSFLCVGFLFSSFNGFVITPNRKKLIASNVPVPFHDKTSGDSQPQSRTGRRNTSYFTMKAKSKSPDTTIGSASSDKVKEMAAFLSIQLLQKVVTESMKPEGERNIDLETVERLTKVLQMSDSQPLSGEPSFEASATMPGVAEDSAKSFDVQTTESRSLKVHDLLAPPENTETQSSEAASSNTTDEFSSLTPTDFQSETPKEKKVKDQAVAPVPESISPSEQVPEIIRSPLEIIQSNIPPLRPESVPRRTPESVEAETQQPAIPVTEEETTYVKLEGGAETMDSQETIVDTLPVDKGVLERQKADESFRRRLLEQRIKYDRNQVTRQKGEDTAKLVDETKIDTKLSRLLETDSDQDIENGDVPLNSLSNDGETQFKSAKTPEFVTASPATDFDEQARSNDKTKGEDEGSSDIEPYALNLTSQRSSSLISERRIETIVALRQPKSSDDEIKLAAKYAQMETLEDRAYALLCDLGMIEEHQDPRDPSYDHSKDDEYCEQRFLPLL